MAGEVRRLTIPFTRGVESSLRRRRLLAARRFQRGALPRFAILLGQWDGGSIVGASVKEITDGI